VFATIEDETGIANVVIWPSLIEQFRCEIVGAALLEVDGRIQRSPEGIVHLVAERLRDRTAELRRLDDGGGTAAALARADEMPPTLPRSRDFH
jgi:error-prone DNA polymerase